MVKKKENLQKYNLYVFMAFLGPLFRRHRNVPGNLLCNDYFDIFCIFGLNDTENYGVVLTLRLDYSMGQSCFSLVVHLFHTVHGREPGDFFGLFFIFFSSCVLVISRINPWIGFSLWFI